MNKVIGCFFASFMLITSGLLSSSCDSSISKPDGISVIKVNLSHSWVVLTEGDELTLTATVYPENASNQKISWSSSDASVAAVADGKVTACKAGTATISAISEDGNKTATCKVTVTPRIVYVEEILLNTNSADIKVGESFRLTAAVKPDNATDKTVVWSSSDSNVATVVGGKVTAKTIGSAVITAQCGSMKAECYVTVNPIEVSSIALDRTSMTLSVEDSFTLSAIVKPDNATDKTVVWSSSDSNVATVVDGKVTAVAVGNATITARTNNGLSASCQICVIRRPAAGGSEGTGEIEW